MAEYQGCDNCKYAHKEPTEMPCLECVHNRAVDNYEPQTNADRIRNMSDEELAEFIEQCEACGYNDGSITPIKDGGHMNMLEWLQAEVEGDSE